MRNHMTKISLAMIARNESEKIKRSLDSIQEYVDEICITDTGSTDDTVSVLKSLPYADKIKISYHTPETHPKTFFDDGKIRSFCDARNFNFEQTTGDWIVWQDCDDIMRNAKELRGLAEAGDKNHLWGFFFPYQYVIHSNGTVGETHNKLQFVKKTAPVSWKGNVHEDLVSSTPNPRFAKCNTIIRSHVMGAPTDEGKALRNLRIIMEDIKEQGDSPDPRTLFYGARAFFVVNDTKSAMPLLEKYVELSGWPEEIYEGMYLLGQCYLDENMIEELRNIAFRAMTIKPGYPDADFLMAQSFIKTGDYKTAMIWLKTGLQKGAPTDHITNFPHRYTVQPIGLYGYCLMMNNQIDEAFTYIKKASDLMPESPELKKNLELITMLKRKREVTRAYGIVSTYLYEHGAQEDIETILNTAKEDLVADAYMNRYRMQWVKPKTWPKKSVVIAALGAVEAWSPKNEVEGGIGGSEEAVINLARKLSKKGYDVTVYSNTGKDDGDYEGVHYKMFTQMNWNDNFDTLVLWRAAQLLDHPWKAQKLLFDMHDVAWTSDWTNERIDKVDAIMVKSEYHKGLFPAYAQNKCVVVGNGINKSHFEGRKVKKELHRCIYPSTIDRGLDILLTAWPEIRKEVPDATLHVYYGFKTYEELQRHNPERMAYLQWIKDKLKELEPQGVVYHGRVDHQTLADEFLKSDVWLYPTQFPEIHCITALKAQKGGAVPVTTNFGALDETVQHGVKIKGDTYKDINAQKEFISEAIRVLKDEKLKEELRPKMAAWADQNDWENVATKWIEQINA